MRTPARERLPETRVHPGRDWFYVLDGTVRLKLGDREVLVEAGQAASFDTMTPHSMVGHGGPAELLTILDHHGERTSTKPEDEGLRRSQDVALWMAGASIRAMNGSQPCDSRTRRSASNRVFPSFRKRAAKSEERSQGNRRISGEDLRQRPHHFVLSVAPMQPKSLFDSTSTS